MADTDPPQEKIKQIIADCSGVEKHLIHDNSWLDTDLYIDSLLLTEMVYALETTFYLSISDSDVREINQVKDVYHLIARKLAKNDDISFKTDDGEIKREGKR